MLGRYAHDGHPRRPPSSLSVSLSTSLSISDTIDLELVDAILSRARDATSFAQVHDAYSRVLEDNGIRPSSDKDYYQFLLKLGMIRARTWGERWDIWRETNAPKVAAAAAPPKRHAAAEQRRTPNPMRARVPFLASASSDLDEGFATESDAGSEVAPQRESPRKAMEDSMRSMVGYTPDTTGLSSDLYVQPVRTSTPVHAQEYDWYRDSPRERGSPTPPPYSESEEGNTTIPSSPMKARVVDGLLTPKPRHILVSINDELDGALVRDMEARADEFYRLGLVGRCWGMWSHSSAWVQRTTAQIDNVRDTLLMRQTLGKWRAVHEFRLQQPGTADEHYKLKNQQDVLDRWLARLRERRLDRLEGQYAAHLDLVAQQQVWKVWRTKLVQRQTKRWQMDLKKREAAAVKQRKLNILRRAFDHWRDHGRQRSADRHFVQTTTRTTFDSWLQKANHARLINTNFEAWERRKAAESLVQAFDFWFKQASLRPLEDTAVKRQERQLVTRAWVQWTTATRRNVTANAFCDKRVLKGAMARLKVSLRKLKVRERQADDVVAVRDRAVVRKSFDTWACGERGLLLSRVLATRQLKGMFAKWHAKLARLDVLEAKANSFHATSGVLLTHTTLSRWRDVLGQKRNATLKADLIFEARTKQALFSKWQVAATKVTDHTATADKAHAFFTARLSFKVWRVALMRKRQVDLVDKRRKKELKALVDVWRDATIRSLVDRQQVERFRQAQDKALLARTLGQWTGRVVELKSRELDVAEHRDASLVQEAFARWRRASKRKADLVALMESFIDVKREESARRAFATWSFKARKAVDLRKRLESFEGQRREGLLAETFAAWHDLKRERQLQEVENEVALRREDSLLFEVFDTWTGRSRLLRAVQFDQRRLRKAVWPRWRQALERMRHVKRVAVEHDLRLQADGFAVWKAAYRARIAKRPALRARRRLSQDRRSSHELSAAAPAVDTSRRSSNGGATDASPPHAAVAASRLRRGPSAAAAGSGAGGGLLMPISTATPLRRAVTASAESRAHLRAMSHSPPVGHRGDSLHLPERAVSHSAAMSVASEPAYSRLRTELRGGGGSGNGGSSGSTSRVVSDEVKPVSELVRALRGTGASKR